MMFQTWKFAIFFIVIFTLYYALPQKYRWMLLLAGSYYFYMSWNPQLVVLILGTTAVTYLCARLLASDAVQTEKRRRAVLAAGVLVPLLVLFFFKYFNFLGGEAIKLLQALSLPVAGRTFDIILPVGISFYTFQALSYVIDVYRGDIAAEKHFGYYALYISFFPQLVAGPIERSRNLLPQFYEEHVFTYKNGADGVRLIALGLFKKLAVADAFGKTVDFVYNGLAEQTGLALIIATVLFAFQIYCDFSGYSDIAVGVARILGFRLMKNFDSPYLARSIKDFWRRWHISLSTWFSDYVYIPLGGNRVSVPRHCVNLLLTFLASGVWHGANWTFLLWGALHGCYMVAGTLTRPLRARARERLHIRPDGALSVACSVAATFLLTCLGWVLFRANTLSDAVYVFRHMFDGITNLPAYVKAGYVGAGVNLALLLQYVLAFSVLAATDLVQYAGDPLAWLDKRPPAVRWCLYAAFVCLTVMLAEKGIAARFIYFQF